MRLPGASELFRPTGTDAPEAQGIDGDRDEDAPSVAEPGPVEAATTHPPPKTSVVGGSGRVRHEEKITVYVSREELLALEQARLQLRAELGLAVDRGRLVRAAIALALSDLDAAGHSGELVRRLTAP